MKRIFLSFSLVLMIYSAVFSQACNPGWASQGFIYPTPDSMQCVVATESFSGSMQINMPSMFHGIITLDSLVVDSITGLPPGITWFSYPYPLVIYGDSSACVSFIGTTPNTVDSGNFPLTFNCHAAVNSPSAGNQILSFQQLQEVGDAPIPYYQLTVIYPGDSCPFDFYVYTSGIAPLISSSDWSVYPNPGSGNFNISINAAKGISGQLAVRDILGRIIYQRHIETTEQYQTSLDLTNFAPGMYMVQLISAAGVASAPKPLIITSQGLK